ncbi:MAG: ATP-binding protein [Desulfopila sp.]
MKSHPSIRDKIAIAVTRFLGSDSSLFFLFLVILLIAVTLASALGMRILRSELQQNDHAQKTRVLSGQIDNIIEPRLNEIHTLARLPLIGQVLNHELPVGEVRLQTALNVARELSNCEIIYILDSRGIAIASAMVDTPSPIGFNYAFRPFFHQAMAGKTDIYPALGVVSGKRGIHLSTPVYEKRASAAAPLGVLILKINIAEIENLLKKQQQRVAIVSPEGIVFATNQANWQYRAIATLSPAALTKIQKEQQFRPLDISPLPLDIRQRQTAIGGDKYFISWNPLQIEGWRIVSLERSDSGYPIPLSYQLLLLTGLGVITVLAFLSLTLSRNIGRRKLTEKKLRLAESKYRSIFENAVMGIYQTSIDGRFRTVNPSLATMLGFQHPEELIEAVRNIAEETYLHRKDRAKLLQEIFEHEEVLGFETQFMKKDRSSIWVSISSRIIRGERREDDLIEGFCLDITEKKRTEETLKRERDVLARVMETSPAGITLMSSDGTITFANQKAIELLRLDYSEHQACYLFGSSLEITDFTGKTLGVAEQPAAQVLRSGKAVYGVQNVLYATGVPPVFLSINMAPVVDATGHIVELVSIFEDITDQIEAEKEELLQKENLIMADRLISMGILASGVAHEINNPNTFIMMNGQFLADAWKQIRPILDDYAARHHDFHIGNLPYTMLRDKLPTSCTRVIEGSRRIKRIVEELRSFSRKEPLVEKIPVDLNQVIRSAEILLASMIKKSTSHFRLQLSDDLPHIRGNPQRLEQVIINILQNSCQALRSTTEAISITTRFDEQSSAVVVVCTDQGSGIEEKILKHVCDPFFSTKRDRGGTGLGLAISSTIVQEHHGSLDIRSRADQGTTITLKFPAADRDQHTSTAGPGNLSRNNDTARLL